MRAADTSERSPGGRTIRFIDFHPPAADVRAEVLSGLRADPKSLSPKLFYDEAGSALFEKITTLPEYYLTRAELEILEERAFEITRLFGRDAVLIEFGSGSSTKVRLLLDARSWVAEYMAIDISRDFLLASARALADAYPDLQVTAVCADYTALPELPEPKGNGRRVIFFPGSTIGNLEPREATEFLSRVCALLRPGDGMLIGVDLAKHPATLDRAYNDEAGVTAAFNLNLLERLNRELGANFDEEAFEHVAFFNRSESRIEMHLRSLRDQTVMVAGETIAFREGESIHTENSYKYGDGRFREMARAAGFNPARRWTDGEGRFAIHWLEVSKALG